MIAPFLAALIAQFTPVSAPQPQACLPDVPLPAAFAAWRDARPLAQGFVVGRAVDLMPVPVAAVRLAVQPSRPLTGSHVAIAEFEIELAGTYSVAAGGTTAPVRPLWLDVAGGDRKPLRSAAHGHGPDCTSVTKVVDFVLSPGHYTFLATGLTSAAPVRVLVAPKP